MLAWSDLEQWVAARYPLTVRTAGGIQATTAAGFIANTIGIPAAYTWKRTGRVPYHSADRVAYALGVHPLDIWSGFHDGIDVEEVGS